MLVRNFINNLSPKNDKSLISPHIIITGSNTKIITINKVKGN